VLKVRKRVLKVRKRVLKVRKRVLKVSLVFALTFNCGKLLLILKKWVGIKIMEKKKGGDLICMRPSSIVEARFNLTKKQNDILDMVFASIENDDKLRYEIDIHKYSKLYKLENQNNVYGGIKKTVKTFEGKGFAITEKISEKKESRTYFSWFSMIKYNDGEGKITVELGQTLKKILLEVKRVIFYKLEYTLNFKYLYSKRIYYYLKLYEDTGIRFDNLDELRDKLECPKSYQKYSLFRQNVLEPAYEEINGNSDISFEYEEVKQKNKVIGITFKIKSIKKVIPPIQTQAKNEVSATVTELEEEQGETYIEKIKSIIESVTMNKLSDKSANEIYKCATNNKEYGNAPLELISEVAEYSKIQNIKGDFVIWFKGTISKYEKPIKVTQQIAKGSFNDYEQRAYDFDQLEKKLLGWEK